MIYDADNDGSDIRKTSPRGPMNLLELLPDEFSLDDYVKVRQKEGYEDNISKAKVALRQWEHRGYVVRIERVSDSYSFIFRKLKFLKGSSSTSSGSSSTPSS